MPLDQYPGIGKFGWLGDQFGVFWQLNLAKNEKIEQKLGAVP
ncbi:MAG TPA: hypothetical protein VIG98_09115 [Bacillus sp. (in: firmicutes)]|jgi:predicted 3-demethylubiquinone-9 3-methyltransferase (glyoxalase superfamily)